MMERDLERFLLDHTTEEDPVLEDLYRQTHIRFVNPNMASGHLQGKFLEFISRMIKPLRILEIGTFTGYSAICLSSGLAPGGRLFTIEANDELAEFTASYFSRAGVSGVITPITGRAQDIIPGLDEVFDLVFIDGDKREYADYFRLVLGKTKPGGFIIADNVIWGGKAFEKSSRDQQTGGIIEFNNMIRQEEGVEILTLPLRDGMMLIRKKD